MARVHAKNALFSFAAVALAADLKNIEQDTSRPMAETTSFADAGYTGLPGKLKNMYKLTGFHDPAVGLADATLWAQINADTASATAFDPGGSATGQTHFAGSGYLVKYAIKSPVNAPAEFTADVDVINLLTRTLNP